jgi:type IV pilus assembly protein PilW
MKGRFMQFSDERGFTLVEILIAMALVTLFMGGLLAMFVGFTKSYTTENVKADVQQVVRGGVEHMVPYIRMAGYEPLTWAEPALSTLDPTDDPTGNGAGFKFAARHKLRFTSDLDMNAVIDGEDGTGAAGKNQERITYFYQNNTLYRLLYEGTGYAETSPQPIVSNVDNFSFTYFDEDGLEIATPATPTATMSSSDRDNIRTILITMTVREPAGRDGFITRTYENRVRCRNIK